MLSMICSKAGSCPCRTVWPFATLRINRFASSDRYDCKRQQLGIAFYDWGIGRIAGRLWWADEIQKYDDCQHEASLPEQKA